MRVILDTNVWVSYLLTQRMSFIDHLLQNQEITILTSSALVEELSQVLSRAKFKSKISKSTIQALKIELNASTETVEITSTPSISRDQDDDFLLAMAEVGKADFLITGDNDLLVLRHHESTAILTPAAFKNVLDDLYKNL